MALCWPRLEGAAALRRRGGDLHELVVQHSVGVVAGRVQELFQPLPRTIVGAVGAHDVELVEAEVRLHGSQSLHLPMPADWTSQAGR